MNQIIFNWMTIKNFFSVGAEVKINFHDYPGMNYIHGINKDLNVKNGSGKSTVTCDALLFALFNKTVKKVNKNNIPHRLVGKEAEVKLNFTVAGDEYTIINTVLPTRAKLYRGDEEITKSTIKETYDFIEREIIKSSYMMFKNSLVLSITGSKNIFEMSKYDKRKFIEQLMNFSQIGEMYKMCKEDLNTLDKELNAKRTYVNKLEEDLEQFKERCTTFKSDQKVKIAATKNQLKLLKVDQKKIKTSDPKLIKVQARITELLATNKESLDIQKAEKAEFDTKIAQLNGDVKSVATLKKKYSSILDVIGTCCISKVDDVLGIGTIEEDIETKKNEIISAKKAYISVKKKIESLQEMKTILIEKQTQTTQKVTQLQSNAALFDRLTLNISDKETELKKDRNEVSPFEELIVRYGANHKTSTDELTTMAERRKYLDFMVFIFSEDGVKKHLISDFINILNTRIRKYLEEMGCEYTALFDTNFDCEFLTTSGPCEYSNFSAGERVRIDTSCLFAFRDLLFGQGTLQSNLLICDEILDSGLDEFAINSIIKILKETTSDQNVFVISHRECIAPEDFDRVILVEKQNGFTTIKNESDLED
jgi:DNA repair exonuclease SbcCD ATPase subunit